MIKLYDPSSDFKFNAQRLSFKIGMIETNTLPFRLF